MSNVPYYAPQQRWGSKYGHQELVDGLQKDGLTDAYNNSLMGNCAELCKSFTIIININIIIGATEHSITRMDQDDYAVKSYMRSGEATKNGLFNEEIIPIEVAQRGKPNKTISTDDEAMNVSNSL